MREMVNITNRQPGTATRMQTNMQRRYRSATLVGVVLYETVASREGERWQGNETINPTRCGLEDDVFAPRIIVTTTMLAFEKCLWVVASPLPRAENPAPLSFGFLDGGLWHSGGTESAGRGTRNHNKENGA